jgi:hypothetical protein
MKPRGRGRGIYTVAGVGKTLREWSQDDDKVSQTIMRKRLNNGWSVERAIITPSQLRHPKNDSNIFDALALSWR